MQQTAKANTKIQKYKNTKIQKTKFHSGFGVVMLIPFGFFKCGHTALIHFLFLPDVQIREPLLPFLCEG